MLRNNIRAMEREGTNEASPCCRNRNGQPKSPERFGLRRLWVVPNLYRSFTPCGEVRGLTRPWKPPACTRKAHIIRPTAPATPVMASRAPQCGRASASCRMFTARTATRASFSDAPIHASAPFSTRRSATACIAGPCSSPWRRQLPARRFCSPRSCADLSPYRRGQTSMISGVPTTTTMIDSGRPSRQ